MVVGEKGGRKGVERGMAGFWRLSWLFMGVVAESQISEGIS